MKYKLWSEDACLDSNGNIWYPGAHYAALFRTNVRDGICEIISLFPHCDFESFRQYSRCSINNNQIVLWPDRAKTVLVYDIEEDTYTTINVENENDVRLGFTFALNIKDAVAALSNGLKILLVVDTHEKRIISDICLKDCFSNNTDSFGSSGCVCGSHIYFTIPQEDRVVQYDVEAGELDIIDMPTSFHPQTITYKNDSFFVSGAQNYLLQFNNNFSKNEKIVFEDELFLDMTADKKDRNYINGEKPFFRKAMIIGDNIWYLPFFASNPMVLKTCSCETMQLEMNDTLDVRNMIAHEMVTSRSGCVCENDKIWFYSCKYDEYILIDTKYNSVRKCHLKYLLGKGALRYFVKNRDIINEGLSDVNSFINLV